MKNFFFNLKRHVDGSFPKSVHGLFLLTRHNYFVSTDSSFSMSSVNYTVVGLRLSRALDFSISSLAGLFLITTNKTLLIPGLVPSAWSLLLSDHPEFGSRCKGLLGALIFYHTSSPPQISV